MKKLKLLITLLLFSTILTNLKAQSYVGFAVDNYSGVHSLISNPSNVVDSRLKADINLISVSAFGGSDYFCIDVSNIIKSEGSIDIESDTEKFPSDANNFF